MKLDAVTAGRIYVDVNVFYMYLRPDPEHLSSLRIFLERMARGDVTAYTSVLTMDELFYRLLLARVKEIYERNPLDVLRENAEEAIERCSPEVEAALRKLIRLPHLKLTPVLEDDFPRMLNNVNTFAYCPGTLCTWPSCSGWGCTRLPQMTPISTALPGCSAIGCSMHQNHHFPEEINRKVAGTVADAHFAPMACAVNPYGDGHAAERIVGALLGEDVSSFKVGQVSIPAEGG